MTQKNINTMNTIVEEMAAGKKLSQALKTVYSKRNVIIPYKEEIFNVSVLSLKMSSRTSNALMRSRLKTLGDVIDYCQNKKITTVSCMGPMSAVELFETILDYCWKHMSQNERVSFLIDTVERNEQNIRA